MTTPISYRKGEFVLLAFLLILGFSARPLSAQDAPAPAVAADATDSTGVVPAAATDGGTAQDNFVQIPNEPTSVSTILDDYEMISGKRLIRDNQLASVPNITINVIGMSRADTLKTIEQYLLLNGIVIIPVDDKTAKVVTSAVGPRIPRSETIKIYTNEADLPTSEQVVTYYMPLSYISPIEAQQLFLQVAPPHGYGSYQPATSAQALVLTENVSLIKELIALKELVDVPPARVTSEFVQLNRADSDTVAAMLTKMLTPTTTPGVATPGGIVPVPPGVGIREPLFNEHNLISGPAQIISIPRSNQLLVVTRPVNMPFLKQLIGQLDEADTSVTPQRRSLNYVLAQDIMPALEYVVAQGKDEETEVKGEQTPATPAAAGAAAGGAGGGGTATNTGSGSGSIGYITAGLSAPTQNNVPTVVTIGKTRLMADNRSNSIIVFGSPDIVSRVFNMIDYLDRKPLQVRLDAVVGTLTVKEGQEFGVDIFQNFVKIGQGGLATSNSNAGVIPGGVGTASFPNPTTLTSVTGFPMTLGGLNLYGAIGSTLSSYVRALETTNRFKTISTPSVYTTNNTLAVISSGESIPVPTSTTSAATGSTTALSTTSSITYQNVVLSLEIIPLINAQHEVTLKIRQTNNNVSGSTFISPNTIPNIQTQEINTVVTVPDKGTVVIGGLISDTVEHDTSGVPWLSRIPVLGNLFKDTNKSKERDELIIMIQPHVVETAEEQIAENEAEKQKSLLGQDSLTGFTGPLPTSPDVVPKAPKPPPATPSGKGPIVVPASPVGPPTMP